MNHKQSAIIGSIDKDQLNYDTNFNPENISYIGPRTLDNHQIITSQQASGAENLQ